MHIGYYSPAWPPAGAANGIVSYVSTIRSYLLANGHDVSVLSNGTLFTSDGGQHVIAPGRSGKRSPWARLWSKIDRRFGHYPFTARQLARQIRRAREVAQIDLFEMEESFGWSGAAQRMLDVPLVTRLHGPQCIRPEGYQDASEARQARERIDAEGSAIRSACAITVPTRTTLDAVRRQYGYLPSPHEVIANPISVSSADLRWSAATCDPDLILNVGRFDHIKGADTMLRAFEMVVARRPNARLIMVGPDTGLITPKGEKLGFDCYTRRYISPEVRARITFAGLLRPEEIAKLRRSAYMTVVAARNENFPYAAIEAMAAGSPLISTEWPGASELVTDDDSGWLCPLEDDAALADRICWLFANVAEAERAGLAAWERCGQVYSSDVIGTRMLRFYQGVLARHAAQA